MNKRWHAPPESPLRSRRFWPCRPRRSRRSRSSSRAAFRPPIGSSSRSSSGRPASRSPRRREGRSEAAPTRSAPSFAGASCGRGDPVQGRAQRAHRGGQNRRRNRRRPGARSSSAWPCVPERPSRTSAPSKPSNRRCFARSPSPFTSSTSGVYLTTTLFPRLGIADEMAGKSTTSGVAAVVRGDAEIGNPAGQRASSRAGRRFRRHDPGGGPKVNVYAAAVVAGSKETEASKRLIALPRIGRRDGGDQEERDGAVETAVTWEV